MAGQSNLRPKFKVIFAVVGVLMVVDVRACDIATLFCRLKTLGGNTVLVMHFVQEKVRPFDKDYEPNAQALALLPWMMILASVLARYHHLTRGGRQR